MLTEILEELDKSGFITVYGGYGKKVKESLYRLTDQYSLFYLTFIEPLGANSKTDFTQLSDLPQWKSWSGYAFENVCLSHVQQIKKALGISGVASSVSSFVASRKEEIPGAQIDLLIDRNDQVINLCEVKFSTSDYEVTKNDVERILNKKRVFLHHSQTKKQIFITLITMFAALNNSNRINYIDVAVEGNSLFAE